MDFNLKDLFTGNNWIILLVGFFLFKDQILAFFQKTPVVVQPVITPVVTPTPGPAPIIVPPDHPIVDVFIKQVLPVLLPILINALKAQEPPK